MQICKKLCKCILAGVVSICILCLLFAPYSSTPVHIENPEGNTDYKWPANSQWSKMTEGISYGRFDANGYNNLEVVDDPDILVLGSSHIEATNVLQTENFATLLGEKMKDTYTTYNMGISGHFFLKVCKYLPKTVEMNPDAKYIIIETSNISYDQKDVDRLLNGKVEFTPSNSTGLIAALQKLPFFRIVYHQLTGGLLDMLMPTKTQIGSDSGSVSEEVLPDAAAYNALFAYIADALQDSDAQLIIMYHPTGELLQDGTVSFSKDEPALAMFRKKCQEYGYAFVDMTEPFEEMYETEHKMPHGFITGKIGSGHLNADGHAKIAEELAQCITALKEAE